MATIKEVLVPDIGDFKDIPVIEVLVKAGDRVKEEDSLVDIRVPPHCHQQRRVPFESCQQ